MREDGLCPVCMLPVPKDNMERIEDDHADLVRQCNTLGEDSLTEQEQVLCRNGVCVDCYYKLE